jgi:hypothetical protein
MNNIAIGLRQFKSTIAAPQRHRIKRLLSIEIDWTAELFYMQTPGNLAKTDVGSERMVLYSTTNGTLGLCSYASGLIRMQNDQLIPGGKLDTALWTPWAT